MTQLPYESIIETIQKLTRDLDTVENQLQILSVEGMEQTYPWRYIVLQRQVDRLVKKKMELQDAWNEAMDELVRCKSEQASQSLPYRQ